jgi:hypothetical protein
MSWEGGGSAGVQARGALAVVRAPNPQRDAAPGVWFCSHCAAKADPPRSNDPGARVCSDCGFGLLLETSAEHAPDQGGAFMVLDRWLSVCAVSAAAERLLATSETDAVNRHVTELVVPADAEAQGPSNLAASVTWAASGDDTARSVVVRPANLFGVRIKARITTCSPPRAALLVFE